jgi:hypothetical protein
MYRRSFKISWEVTPDRSKQILGQLANNLGLIAKKVININYNSWTTLRYT